MSSGEYGPAGGLFCLGMASRNLAPGTDEHCLSEAPPRALTPLYTKSNALAKLGHFIPVILNFYRSFDRRA
ncbi:hypothetical protein BM221_009015 [Beauveria bassiana]|uniref:Uncharacterized protein n=1 Tax=Beauveria bassiana TaxID=176275 RepID=A0A2N6NC26_BEABA|nr:hypothetical protein BM221_009015 [Beauveria bassiana]